ncbi:MAG: hypothetical protein WC606_00405 [Candidatus Absconditabacterales bacterium]
MTSKVQEYIDLEHRTNNIDKGIFIDFGLIPPKKLSAREFPDLLVPNGKGNRCGDALGFAGLAAVKNNLEIELSHASFLEKAVSSANISKTFVALDEFLKNPDKYILLTEYLAGKDGSAILYRNYDGEHFFDKIRILFDKKYKEILQNKRPVLFPSKNLYNNAEDFPTLVKYLIENDIDMDLLNPITGEKYS